LFDIRNPVSHRNEIHRHSQAETVQFNDECKRLIEQTQLKAKLFDFHVRTLGAFADSRVSPPTSSPVSPPPVLPALPMPPLEFIKLLQAVQRLPQVPKDARNYCFTDSFVVALPERAPAIDIFGYFSQHAERYNFRNLDRHGIAPALYFSNQSSSVIDQAKLGIKDVDNAFSVVVMMQSAIEQPHRLSLQFTILKVALNEQHVDREQVEQRQQQQRQQRQQVLDQMAAISLRIRAVLQSSLTEVMKHYERDLLWSYLWSSAHTLDSEHFRKLQDLIVRTPLHKLDPTLDELTSLPNINWQQAQAHLATHMKLTRSVYFDRGISTTHHLFVFSPKDADFCVQLSCDDDRRPAQLLFCSREFRALGVVESELISIVINQLLFYVWKNLKI
jgi:hypothetical protein